ncbi:MAG: hypothetical protein ABIE74_08045 [Pseudomonadota bacterium]
MLRFLFNRDSKFITIIEIAAIVGGCYLVLNHLIVKNTDAWLFAITWSSYAFLKFCTLKRWHNKSRRESGIGLHFKKAIVATNYILAISNWLYVAFQQSSIFWVSIILLAVIIHVNLILIYINSRYHSHNPANFLSAKNQ